MSSQASPMPSADTFSRSCDHWSEQGRSGMEQFYVLATEDYRQLALSHDWAAWLHEHEKRAGDRPLRLLDVACGSGKFPIALQTHANLNASTLKTIQTDLLDPTQFSLNEAARVLEPPFELAGSHLCRLQDFEASASPYDVVWATHALYALPLDELADGLKRFAGAIAPNGSGFIAHACSDAHYLNFYRMYLDSVRKGDGTQYTSAEQIERALQTIGAQCESRDISYVATANDDAAVEGYLQRCLFDDSLTLQDMLGDPVMGPYLKECRSSAGWQFRQRVKMIFFTH